MEPLVRSATVLAAAFVAWVLWYLGIGWFNGSEGLEWLHGFQWGALPASAAIAVGCAAAVARDYRPCRLSAFLVLATALCLAGFAAARDELYWLHSRCSCLAGFAPLIRLATILGGRVTWPCLARQPFPCADALVDSAVIGSRARLDPAPRRFDRHRISRRQARRYLQRHKARLPCALGRDPPPCGAQARPQTNYLTLSGHGGERRTGAAAKHRIFRSQPLSVLVVHPRIFC